MSKNKIMLIALGFLAIILLGLGALVFQYNLKYKETAFPKVYINGQSFAGISKTDAVDLLGKKIEAAYKDNMKFVYKDKTYAVPLSELGISINAEKTIDEVIAYGHKGGVLDNAREQISMLQNNIDFKNELSENNSPINGSAWEEIARIESPAQNFSYEWSGSGFSAVTARDGFVIDKDKLKKGIEDNLENLQNNPVQITLKKDKTILSDDMDGQALKDAQNFINREIVLKSDTELWKISKEDFGNWIGFTPETDNANGPKLVLSPNIDKIKTYLTSLVPEIDHEPVNAQLEFAEGKVGVFALSQEGIQLDVNASAEKIGKELFQTKNYSSSADSNLTSDKTADKPDQGQDAGSDNPDQIIVELILNKKAPDLTTENIDNMGITSLLATGESNFHGSTVSRQHNISVGASKFNGILIGPGDTFSFDKILGEVGPKQGYLPELVIKSGKTTPEYGGGLCQVSTTAFRGAVAAGLEVTERTNHAYAVKYYAPQGTDATIYPPNPDLVFINNTPSYILIQTRTSGTYLYFDFYGTNDGRKVVTEGPVVYERGDGGAMKTWWKQSVYDKDGKLFLTKTFYSNYKPAALYPRTNPLE